GLDREAEHRGLAKHVVIQRLIAGVEIHRDVEPSFRSSHAAHMVHVRVRQENVPDCEHALLDKRQQLIDFIARVNEHRLMSVFATEHEAVLEERRDRLHFKYHAVSMVLAIVDDLMFVSKIKAAASSLGISLTVARSMDAALEHMRQTAPSLVILDLNGTRTDPLGTVAAMKRDPELSAIPTIGFV